MKKLKIKTSFVGLKIQGQGVGAATIEQMNLLKDRCGDYFEVLENKGRGDILHVHTIDPRSSLRATFSRVPVVMHVHFIPETLEGSIKLPKWAARIYNWYVLNTYKKASNIVVVNPIFIKDLDRYGIVKERVNYIPNFVNEETFFKGEISLKHRVREKYGIAKDAFVVLGVGQVQTRKGVIDFVEVAKRLPDIQFVWAGGFSFGKITDGYEQLKKIIENPPQNVKFLGIINRTEMNDIYNMTDVFFMPSYNELFPMAILESCSSGVPMLLRDLDLYEDILFHKYLHAHDNEGFIDLLQKLKSDEEVMNQAREYSAFIKNHYSRDNVAKLWIDYYHKVKSDNLCKINKIKRQTRRNNKKKA